MARMLSLGKSKENREMWALELSNNPSAIEAKPNARYIGNMHGDEPASRCLPYVDKLDDQCLMSIAASRHNGWQRMSY